MSSLNYTTVKAFLDEVKQAQEVSAQHSRAMSRLLVGNLKSCDHSTLAKLKKEIAGFNMQTGRWRQ